MPGFCVVCVPEKPVIRAFARKLQRLLDEARQRQSSAHAALKVLEGEHPEYLDQYERTYQRALQECGIPTENVPFLKYLRDEEISTSSSAALDAF